MLGRIRDLLGVEGARTRLAPNTAHPLKRVRPARRADGPSIQRLWDDIAGGDAGRGAGRAVLADPETVANAGLYAANIENMIGTVKVPVGVIGPLRVNGLHAQGDYHVPLATTEAALVASYARGADIISRAGGASAALLSESVARTPAFVFADLYEAGLFIDWLTRHEDLLTAAAEATTRFGKLVAVDPVIDSNVVFLQCRYTTGDASGQNMVTIATDALCRAIEAATPVRPRRWYIEANFSGDKKASYLGLIGGRGRKVTASAVIPAALVEQCLHTTAADMLDYGRVANLGALMSGQIGAQAHYANALAAFYLATGQDVACVSESSVGFTRMEPHADGLAISVTLPNVLVGSVGGGTRLPSQAASLDLLGLRGTGHAGALAEIAAALCLAGELSIVGAIAAGHFARAHRKLARTRG